MKCTYACGTPAHRLSRRAMLGQLAGMSAASGTLAAGSLGVLARPAAARQLASQQKRILVFDLLGGVSQLESWDPKPRTDTGGPFRAIGTSVPGVHISELLPYTARQMHHLALVRSINTKENDHGRGHYIMDTGRPQEPALEYPHLGAVAARFLAPQDDPLPGYIRITPGGSGINQADAAFLGPRYAAVTLGNGQPPSNSVRPDSISDAGEAGRHRLRQQASDRFALGRRTAQTEAYTFSYDQALELMQRRELFDVARESEADQQRYGSHDFGRHTLLARRLLEHGVTFVKVSHSNYDTHNENFNFHIEQLGEFDRPFANIIEDLADRGMLESTLVLVISEFGRTPRINHLYGRDHWGTSWSICLGGCGIQPGAVIGRTNDNGTEVADREVNGGHLFHTYLRAVGLDPTHEYTVNGRPVPMADPQAAAIEELLT